jgi:hypothetical protein
MQRIIRVTERLRQVLLRRIRIVPIREGKVGIPRLIPYDLLEPIEIDPMPRPEVIGVVLACVKEVKPLTPW